MTVSIPSKEKVIRPVVIYGAAVIATFAATLIRMNLTPLVGTADPFITYFAATLFVAWYSGFPAALITVLMSAWAGFHFFVLPGALLSFISGFSDAGFSVVSFVITGVAASFLLDLQREISERRDLDAAVRFKSSAREEREARKKLEATLASIPEAVVSTDLRGRVVFANLSALRLLRAGLKEVLGRNVEEVFRIVRESNTQANPGPSAMLPEVGKGPVLIARDNTRVPIEDIRVALRGTNGDLQGSVLVFRDMSDRKRSELALDQANAELVRANRELERFAFVACHDLQEPLRRITINAQQLIANFPSSAEARGFVENIRDGSKCMTELLRDLLQYAELGSTLETSMHDVNLNEVVAQVRANLSGPLEAAEAVVTCDALPVVRGQAAHFTSVFQNLIGNAVKYRSERPLRIHISARASDVELRFAVTDNGIGIEPRYQLQIFDAFRRLHGREIPGTGVGLAICKRVVETYGGRIWVDSQAGEGSTFYFSLPGSHTKVEAAPVRA